MIPFTRKPDNTKQSHIVDTHYKNTIDSSFVNDHRIIDRVWYVVNI